MALNKGTEVEVTSNDDGFRGVWYVAKITQPPEKSDDDNESYVVVEYNDLVSEEDESKKLCERVHVSLVRPLSPSIFNDNVVIEVNDVIDVFHKDGWWVGVVEEFVDKDEFLVCFDDPPDKMLVNKLDVRLHLDWVLGTWQKPKKKNLNKDSSRLAIPSDHPENSKKQNRSSIKEQAGKSCAPTGMHLLLDEPNVNYQSLNITLDDDTEKKDMGKNDEIVEKECNAEVDMSVRERNGVSGKNCEIPLKKDQKNKIMDEEMHTVADSSRPAMLSKQSGYSRRQKTRSEKQQAGKSCVSTEKMATGMHGGIVEKECNAKKVNMSVKEVRGVPPKICETPPKKDEKNKSLDQEMHTVDVSSRLAVLSNQSGNSKRQSRRVKKQQAEKGSVSKEKKDKTGVHVDIVEKECITEVVKGALSAKDYETSPKKYQKKQSTDQEITTVDSTNGSTQGDVSSKRKRGIQIGKGSTEEKRSLRKTIMEDSCVGDEAEINTKNDRLMQIAVDDKSKENHFQPSTNDRMKVTADKKHTSGIHKKTDLLGETAIIPLREDQAGETVPSKRVRQSKNSNSNEHEGMSKLVYKCQNASQGNTYLPEICHAKDVNMLLDGIVGDLNDDQLSNSSLQVDKPSSMGSDASRTLPLQCQCANANGRQDDFGTFPAAKKDRMDNTDGLRDLPVKNLNQAGENGELRTPARVSIDNMEDDQSFPFTKCSPLWKAIESMEIYESMTQRPHFSPLIKFHEETREGYAIAHMVNFSNLVEKTRTLQFSHPITVIESSLETLADLESNGFDVETIRACLTQLLSKKQMGEELQKKYQDIESEISNSFDEKQKVDEEINQLDQKMNKLVVKLGDAVSRKEMKERVISTLKLKQDVVRQNVQGLELDFQNIAGSLR